MSILSQRISGLFRLFKPVEVNVFGERVIEPKLNTDRTNAMAVNVSDQETVDLDPEQLQDVVENHPVMMKRLNIKTKSGREQALEELRKGYNEVVELARSVRVAVEQQTEQTKKMGEVMGTLPKALSALPETNRNQGRMVEAMHGFLQKQETRDDQIQKALGEIALRNDQQTEILMMMQQQNDMMQANAQVTNEVVGSVSHALNGIAETNHRVVSAMERIGERMASHDEQVKAVTRSHVMGILTAGILGSALMLGGIVGGWYAAQMMGMSDAGVGGGAQPGLIDEVGPGGDVIDEGGNLRVSEK